MFDFYGTLQIEIKRGKKIKPLIVTVKVVTLLFKGVCWTTLEANVTKNKLFSRTSTSYCLHTCPLSEQDSEN